ncbi:MAG: ImmA/IrrE family metallo-endopeptidase [Candidatus Kaiserbacteria bacterium]|nr:ImmA/IrrE family metallo-endopeptidase [Candidatus Kaiserbacteria bacterium]
MSDFTPYYSAAMIEEQAWQDLLNYRRKSSRVTPFPIYVDEVLNKLWNVEVRYMDNVRDADGEIALAAFSPELRAVFLNTSARANEGQVSYSLAHEAGHVSLHAFLDKLGHEKCFCSPNPLSPESRANILESHADQYASAFLMPRDAVKEAVERCKPDLRAGLDLKKYGRALRDLFGVSHQALEIRLSNLGIKTAGGFYKTSAPRRTAARRELDAMDEEREFWSLYQ